MKDGPVRITLATVRDAERRRAPGRVIVRDAGCRGLALVVNPTTSTWVYSYRPRGADPATGKRWPNRSVTLGNPATHNPDEARAAANAIKGQAAAGADPAAEKRVAIKAASIKRARTLDRLLEAYAKALPTRPKMRGTGTVSAKHAAEELAHAKAAVETMQAGDTPAGDVTAAELRALLNAEAARPATARARFGALSRFFDWCQDEGHISLNPCALVARQRRPRAIQARAHYLPLGDLAKLWRAADRLRQGVHCDLVRFLIAVPCRRGEAIRLDWTHLDLAGGAWTLPGAMTKNGDAHKLHLHSIALGILRTRHAAAKQPSKGFVFPAPTSGKAIDTFSDLKAELVKLSGVDGWRWHDTRRSFASIMAERGVAEPVADAVLNHRQSATRGGVLGVYQRSTRWPEQVAAMTAWGEALDGALSPEKPRGKVATLQPRGRRVAA